MGEWRRTEAYPQQLVQVARALGVDAKLLIDHVAATGMLVTKAFYVPDADELLGLMRNIQYHLRRGNVECRWVMCRETVDALAEQWNGRRTPAPTVFDASFWQAPAGQELPTAALEVEVLRVLEHNRRWLDQSKLFGVPIRVDAAARSPLFEIDTDDTKWRRLGDVVD